MIFEELFELCMKFKYPEIKKEELNMNLNDTKYIKKYQIDCCSKGCECFINERENEIKCSECKNNRFLKCMRGECIKRSYEDCKHSFNYRTSVNCCFYIPSYLNFN